MFAITKYSLWTALIVSNLFSIFFIFLSNSSKVLLKTSWKIFAVIGILLLIRLFIPLEFWYAKEIVSYKIYPKIIDILNHPLFDIRLYHLELRMLLILIWITVSVFLLFHKIKSYRTFVVSFSCETMICEKKMEDILAEVKEINGYSFPTTLIVDKGLDSVMEFGFFRQTILLPDVAYSERELRYILYHELEHFANKTNWIKLFITILEVLFWWNPLVYLFRSACTRLLEIYCDYAISKEFTQEEKLEYLECLIQEAKREYSMRAKNGKGESFYISNFAFGSHLKQRFEVFWDRKRNIALEFVIGIVALISFFYSYSFVFQPGYNPPAVDFDNILQKGYEIRRKEDEYDVYIDGKLFMIFDSEEAMKNSGLYSIGGN